MPKRKAHEATSSVGTSGPDSAIKSPNRKKSKKEALAAAREWHDKRLKPGVGVSASDNDSSSGIGKVKTQQAALPRIDGKPSAKPAATEKNTATTKKQQTLSDTIIPAQSPLIGEAKSSKSNGGSGGNTFLKALRKEKIASTAVIKDEVASSDSMNGKPSPVAELVKSSVTSTSDNVPVQKDKAKNLSKGEFLLVLFLLLLNVAVAIYMIYCSQHILHNKIQEQHESEVEKIKAELSKTLEVEALLRSGVGVLDQELQMNINGMKDLKKVPTLYNILLEQQDGGLQSREEKDAWLKKMKDLDKVKQSAVDDWLLSVTAEPTGAGKKRYDYLNK